LGDIKSDKHLNKTDKKAAQKPNYKLEAPFIYSLTRRSVSSCFFVFMLFPLLPLSCETFLKYRVFLKDKMTDVFYTR
jgi:hypothetical protein